MRIPRAVRSDLAAVHAHGGGGEKILEATVQQLHSLHATHPQIILRAGTENSLPLLRVRLGGVERRRAFLLLHIGEQVIRRARAALGERHAQRACAGARRQRGDGPRALVHERDGQPVGTLVGTRRVGRAGFQHADLELNFIVLRRRREYERANGNGLRERDDDVLLAVGILRRLEPDEAVARGLARRRVLEAQQSERVGARVRHHLVRGARLARRGVGGEGIREVHIHRARGVVEPVISRVDGEEDLVVVRRKALQAALPLGGGLKHRDGADLLRFHVHGPDGLGLLVHAGLREVVGVGHVENRLAVRREHPRAGETLEGMMAPVLAALEVALNQGDTALRDRRAEEHAVAPRAGRTRRRVVREPAAGAAGGVEPRGALGEITADVRIRRHLVTQLERRVRDGLPLVITGRNVVALLVLQIPRDGVFASGLRRVRDEVADARAVRAVEDERDLAGLREVVADLHRRLGGDGFHNRGRGLRAEVGEDVEAGDARDGAFAGLRDDEAERAGLHGVEGQPAARAVLRGLELANGFPLLLGRGGGVDTGRAAEGLKFKRAEIVLHEHAVHAPRVRPREDEPRGLQVGDGRAGVDARVVPAGVDPLAVAARDVTGVVRVRRRELRGGRVLGLGIRDGGGRVVRQARGEQPKERRLPRVARHRHRDEQRARLRARRQRREPRRGLAGLDGDFEPVARARRLRRERRTGLEHAQFADAPQHGADGDGLFEHEEILDAGRGLSRSPAAPGGRGFIPLAQPEQVTDGRRLRRLRAILMQHAASGEVHPRLRDGGGEGSGGETAHDKQHSEQEGEGQLGMEAAESV